MLRIVVPETELFDEVNNAFQTVGGGVLELEHSLFSVSLWESKWHKPFVSEEDRNYEETISYVKCMTLNTVDQSVYDGLTKHNMEEIQNYISDPMTATWFSEKNGGAPSKKVITSEVIYYQMVSLNIPFECEHWHLNRLLTLIRVCSEKNAPPKKMSKAEIRARNKTLNDERKKRLGTRG